MQQPKHVVVVVVLAVWWFPNVTTVLMPHALFPPVERSNQASVDGIILHIQEPSRFGKTWMVFLESRAAASNITSHSSTHTKKCLYSPKDQGRKIIDCFFEVQRLKISLCHCVTGWSGSDSAAFWGLVDDSVFDFVLCISIAVTLLCWSTVPTRQRQDASEMPFFHSCSSTSFTCNSDIWSLGCRTALSHFPDCSSYWQSVWNRFYFEYWPSCLTQWLYVSGSLWFTCVMQNYFFCLRDMLR